MPIIIPSKLPAYSVLETEGVMVMSRTRASHQDIRPIEIGLLNLMPDRVTTETQFARLLGSTPLQINLTLIRMTKHKPKHTPVEYLEKFYVTYSDVEKSGKKFDGLIITGAPIEHLNYVDVDYWNEFENILDWTQTHVHSSIGICWGGMAMLYHWYNIDKYQLPKKYSGCFLHKLHNRTAPILRGFTKEFIIPVSRWTTFKRVEIKSCHDLNILIDSIDTGICLVENKSHRSYVMLNHFEYDHDTLKREYERDYSFNPLTPLPNAYFPNNDPTKQPRNSWRSHGHLFYGNWINEIYQSTPYDIDQIGH